MRRETGLRFHEGNYEYVLIDMVNDVTDDDIVQLKEKVHPHHKEGFDKLPKDEKERLVVLDRLTSEELTLLWKLNPNHLMGMHDLKNKIVLYELLFGVKVKHKQ